ncbi:sigma-54 interaction domain-containing protein [Desulfotalea psychrophila]|uniref:Probable transcription regulator (HydG) n=1 Tax=Desulfotalea psychrophila (strain LSv54 / DSM 12343) TaxID=177439 RepID=Q6ARF9_DESPS|nr:sigma-54-dependent Fis family transcriptional regulator [Desulfotalea psychrophila]CAG35066.1 probable transcription regulator (HydG) [Desulfotalea psychrophila LSv54]
MSEKKKPAINVSETIIESISEGLFTVDHQLKITSFNRAAEKILGISRQEAIGKHCWEIFQSNMCAFHCALKRTIKEKKSFTNSSTFIRDHKQQKIPVIVSTSVLQDEAGNILGGVEIFRTKATREELPREATGNFHLENMVSRSPKMQDLFAILKQVAQSDSTVLVEGETGTGKELLARAIHNLSSRAKRPFVAVNCGALPDTLLESELFGYKAGAFTDARHDKDGLFAAAANGTIFLDEIGDTSPAFQVRLLRVLEEREFQPLGSTKKIATNARIITATNKDLSQLIHKGLFRQDLFYRINVIILKLPPLRERREDIPLLIEQIISKLNNIKNRQITGLSPEAEKYLLSHDYPGNIRELENIIEHAFILCRGNTIDYPHFPAYLQQESRQVTLSADESPNSFDWAEKETILKALEQNGYNRQAAADHLRIHKSTLFRKIKRLGIKLPNQDGRHRKR